MEQAKYIEIERKFLVKGDFMPFISKSYPIKQGYIVSSKGKTVRVRIKGDTGYLTIKGATNENGFARFEWEKEITVEEAELLMELCENSIIDKIRYEVVYAGKVFEVDRFLGENEGLLLAELELEAENETYESPDWLGEEVIRFGPYLLPPGANAPKSGLPTATVGSL